MQIIYISNSIIPSRTANSIHVMKMCQALAINGHEVTLLAPNRHKEYENNIKDIYQYYGVKNNFKIKKLPFLYIKGSSFIYSFFIWLFLILNKKPYLIYGRFCLGCYIAALTGNKTILEVHNIIKDGSKLENWCFERLIKNKNFIKLIVISNALKNIYSTYNYLDDDKIQVAHDGADEVNDYSLKVVLGGDVSALKVGYVGHLYKGRGIDIVLNCAKVLTDVTFHIVGGTDDDISYWKDHANKIGADNIYFYGFVSPADTIGFRNSFDILLAPYSNKVSVSGNKGDTSAFMSPLKIFEYMAHGKAIICSDLPVLKEILNHENSILVDPNDYNKWVDAINNLRDTNLRNKLAHNAHRDFNKYSWNHRVSIVLNVDVL